VKTPKPAKRNGPARALAKPETRQRVIPDKREKAKDELAREITRGTDHGSPWDE